MDSRVGRGLWRLSKGCDVACLLPKLVGKGQKKRDERVGTGLVRCNRVRKRRAIWFDSAYGGLAVALCYFGALWCCGARFWGAISALR
jgi:hypothetical protein